MKPSERLAEVLAHNSLNPPPQRSGNLTPFFSFVVVVRLHGESVVVPLSEAPWMLSLELLRPLVRTAWGSDTCYPNASEEWRPDNPARAQCGMTALVVQDLLGGDLILGEVHVDGAKVGNHYWNRLPDGTEIDLTADQFFAGEVFVNGQVVHRPPDAPRRFREQYELLRERVLMALAPRRVRA
jgi:hypothetical protein